MLQRLLGLLLWLHLISALPSGLQPQAKQNAVVAKTHKPRMILLSDNSYNNNQQASVLLPMRPLSVHQRRQLPKSSKGAKGGKGGKSPGGLGGLPPSGLPSGGGLPRGPSSAAPPPSSSGGGPKGPSSAIPGLDNLDALGESLGHDLGKTIGSTLGTSILGDTLGAKVGTSLGNIIGGKLGKAIGGQANEFLSGGGLDQLLNKALGGLLPASKLIEMEGL